VLVVDLYPLQPVYLLNFIHQELGQLLDPHNPEDVVRIRRAIHQCLTGLDIVALMHTDVLAFGNKIFLGLTHLRGYDHPFLTLEILAKAHLAVDLGDNRILLGLADLKELGNSGETAGNILCFRGFPGDLAEHGSRLDDGILRHRNQSANRQGISRRRACFGQLCRLPGLILHGNPGVMLSGAGRHDNMA